MIGIYRITNKINGKCYIGQSIDIKKRIWNHMCSNNAKYPDQIAYEYPIYRAMRKYGRENFEYEILEECDIEELAEKELFYINKYDSIKRGYNQTMSTTNPLLDPDIMQKAIENMTKNHRTKEHRNKQSKITKTLWKNEDYREKVIKGIRSKSHVISRSSKLNWEKNRDKMSIAIKKAFNTDEVRKHRSEMQKERIKNDEEYALFLNSLLTEGRKTHHERMKTDDVYRRKVIENQRKAKSKKFKGVSMLDKQRNFIRDFVSLAESARWVKENTNYKKADYSTIRNAAKRDGTAYGYRWKLHKSQETIRKE